SRGWNAPSLSFGPGAQDRQIGLKLRLGTDSQGTLDNHGVLVRKLPPKLTVKPNQAPSMPFADGRHFDDFSFDEFDAFVLIEDSRLDHFEEFLGRKGAALNFER